MDFERFHSWLQSNKRMTERSASDVASRVRRALKITGAQKVDSETYNQLASSAEYQSLSVNIRSQLKRALALYNEFAK